MDTLFLSRFSHLLEPEIERNKRRTRRLHTPLTRTRGAPSGRMDRGGTRDPNRVSPQCAAPPGFCLP